MSKEAILRDQIIPQETQHLSTSQLAKLCGVSRFSIINWVHQGKIKTINTVGGHSRISLPEAISFLEDLHLDKEKKGKVSEALLHCWEHAENTRCKTKCGKMFNL